VDAVFDEIGQSPARTAKLALTLRATLVCTFASHAKVFRQNEGYLPSSEANTIRGLNQPTTRK